jgi:hypothetical protein
MDELDKGLDIALRDEARDAALRRFQTVIRQWRVALPPVEPLVLDFGLGEFETNAWSPMAPEEAQQIRLPRVHVVVHRQDRTVTRLGRVGLDDATDGVPLCDPLLPSRHFRVFNG